MTEKEWRNDAKNQGLQQHISYDMTDENKDMMENWKQDTTQDKKQKLQEFDEWQGLHKFTRWTKDYHNHYDFDKNNLRMTSLFKDPELT